MNKIPSVIKECLERVKGLRSFTTPKKLYEKHMNKLFECEPHISPKEPQIYKTKIEEYDGFPIPPEPGFRDKSGNPRPVICMGRDYGTVIPYARKNNLHILTAPEILEQRILEMEYENRGGPGSEWNNNFSSTSCAIFSKDGTQMKIVHSPSQLLSLENEYISIDDGRLALEDGVFDSSEGRIYQRPMERRSEIILMEGKILTLEANEEESILKEFLSQEQKDDLLSLIEKLNIPNNKEEKVYALWPTYNEIGSERNVCIRRVEHECLLPFVVYGMKNKEYISLTARLQLYEDNKFALIEK